MGDNELMFILLITLVLIVFAVTPGVSGMGMLAQEISHVQLAYDR